MEKIPDIIHESWHPYLQPLFDDTKMLMLKNNILPQNPFYPAPMDIFRVFSTPLNDIKVVILGQDPYPNGEAIGLAFAVKSGFSMPVSLQVIKNEILGEVKNDNLPIHISENEGVSSWQNLSHWQEQGVFLLNTALTVQVKQAGSHLNYWQWFTREVIKVISYYNPCIWLLWGAKARSFMEYINKRVMYSGRIDNVDGTMNDFNYILTADHPAAEKYNGGTSSTKFTGCRHFHTCNEILLAREKPVILW